MVEIVRAESDEEYAEVARLIRAYVLWLPFPVAHQDVEDELDLVRTRYGPPRGAALLAKTGDGRAVGVVALKDLGAGVCEMKRLFVEPSARGEGAGRLLADAIVAEGRTLGYDVMRLDTYPPALPEASRLYESMGFSDIENYNANPMEGVRFMELALR